MGEEGRMRRRREGKKEVENCGIKIAYCRKIKTNDANLQNDDPESQTRRVGESRPEGEEAQGAEAVEKDLKGRSGRFATGRGRGAEKMFSSVLTQWNAITVIHSINEIGANIINFRDIIIYQRTKIKGTNFNSNLNYNSIAEVSAA
jgi:hypothetical protein